jgi:hypothetical protein
MQAVALLERDDRPALQGVWEMPHHGRKGERCGDLGFRGHMEGSMMHHEPYRHDCRRYECPAESCRTILRDGVVVRLAGWEAREGQRIANRIERLLPEGRRAIHVVASPYPRAAVALLRADPVQGLSKLRGLAVRTLRRWGMRGGALVFHYHRIPSRWNERTECAEGPHFHALGDGWILPPEGHRSSWVIKNLGVRKDTRATAAYLCSHAARFRSLPAARLEDQPHKEGARSCAVGTQHNAAGGLVVAVRPQPHPEEQNPQGGARSCAVGTPGSSTPGRGYPALPQGTRPQFRTLAVTWFGSMSYNKARLSPEDVADSYMCKVCCRQVPIDEWLVLRWVRKRDPPEAPGVSDADAWVVRSLARDAREVEDDPVVRAMVERALGPKRRAMEAWEDWA